MGVVSAGGRPRQAPCSVTPLSRPSQISGLAVVGKLKPGSGGPESVMLQVTSTALLCVSSPDPRLFFLLKNTVTFI